jgi:hypothetical protein
VCGVECALHTHCGTHQTRRADGILVSQAAAEDERGSAQHTSPHREAVQRGAHSVHSAAHSVATPFPLPLHRTARAPGMGLGLKRAKRSPKNAGQAAQTKYFIDDVYIIRPE